MAEVKVCVSTGNAMQNPSLELNKLRYNWNIIMNLSCDTSENALKVANNIIHLNKLTHLA